MKQQSVSERIASNACRRCNSVGETCASGWGTTARMTALQVLEHLYEAAALVVNSQQSDLELGTM